MILENHFCWQLFYYKTERLTASACSEFLRRGLTPQGTRFLSIDIFLEIFDLMTLRFSKERGVKIPLLWNFFLYVFVWKMHILYGFSCQTRFFFVRFVFDCSITVFCAWLIPFQFFSRIMVTSISDLHFSLYRIDRLFDIEEILCECKNGKFVKNFESVEFSASKRQRDAAGIFQQKERGENF